MKTLIKFLLLFQCFGCASIGFAQEEKSTSEFLYAVVEFERIGDSDEYDVSITTATVHPQKLKRPTKSERVTARDRSHYQVQIVDSNQQLLDEITVRDPLLVNFEYVNHEGQLAHKIVREQKKTIVVRRPISSNASTLIVRSAATGRSTSATTFKFR